MIRVAFCDDDRSVLDQLKELIDQYCTKHNQELAYTVFYSSLELPDLQIGQAVREIVALRESWEKTGDYRHTMRHHMQFRDWEKIVDSVP